MNQSPVQSVRKRERNDDLKLEMNNKDEEHPHPSIFFLSPCPLLSFPAISDQFNELNNTHNMQWGLFMKLEWITFQITWMLWEKITLVNYYS